MKYIVGLISAFLLLQGCASVNTFPTVARQGDTVNIMIGGTEKARKDTVSVILTDSAGADWDLKALGLVRSVFNLRADGRSVGAHYSPYLDSYISWSEGHEPVQAVLVVDIPAGVPIGFSTLTIDTFVDDDSSGIGSPHSVNIEILDGLGNTDEFLRDTATSGQLPVDFNSLEPAPHAKINFGVTDGVTIGAASLVIDFDETILNPDDINVYVPESNVRGSVVDPGAFGKTQRMVYWHQDGLQLYIDIIAPQGINQAYLMAYIIHPQGLASDPTFTITSSTIYDVSGYEIVLTPTLEYFQ